MNAAVATPLVNMLQYLFTEELLGLLSPFGLAHLGAHLIILLLEESYLLFVSAFADTKGSIGLIKFIFFVVKHVTICVTLLIRHEESLVSWRPGRDQLRMCPWLKMRITLAV